MLTSPFFKKESEWSTHVIICCLTSMRASDLRALYRCCLPAFKGRALPSFHAAIATGRFVLLGLTSVDVLCFVFRLQKQNRV